MSRNPTTPRKKERRTTVRVSSINQRCIRINIYELPPTIEAASKPNLDPSKFKIFNVHVFSKEPCIQVKIAAGSHRYLIAGNHTGQGTLCSYPNIITVGEVKERVRQALTLKSSSEKIFGLFLGPLGFPTALLHDADPVPQDTTTFSFQRLSFHPNVEITVTNDDYLALDLIFKEVKYMFECHNIRPRTTPQQLSTLLEVIDHEEEAGSEFSLEGQRHFVQSIRKFPLFYWSYYYYASNCILLSYLHHNLRENKEMTIATDIEKLVFLDIFNDQKLASWPWEMVSYVKIKESPNVIVFDLLVLKKGRHVLKSIMVDVDRCKYLFTIIIHILRIHEARKGRPLLSGINDSLCPTSTTTNAHMENGFLIFSNQTFSDKISYTEEEEEEHSQWILPSD